MSALDEIRTGAETAREAFDAATTSVLAAINEAHEKGQHVAALGLEGVARTVLAAHSSLEAVAASLSIAHDTAGDAVTILGEITNPARIGETVARLGAATGHFHQATSRIESAIGSAHEAYNYAQQAEINSLISVIGSVFDGLSSARQSIADAKAKTEAYRQQVEAVAEGN